MRRITSLLICVSFVFLQQSSESQQQQLGIAGHKAPSWQVSDWHQLPDAVAKLDVSSYRGKVLYLYCFQSWCPGCHKSGFPTLQQVIKHYADDEDVAFVAIQTSFEGFRTNTFEQAREVARQYGLKIPFGQSGGRDQRSALMRAYRTGGTPWTIIIDRDGIVRFNDYHISAAKAVRLIDRLKQG